MKNTIIILLLLLTFSCKKEEEECRTCLAIIESNEAIRCGFANNGWEEIDRQSLGRKCGPEIEQTLAIGTTTNETVSSCGTRYTLRTTINCDQR